MNLGLFAVWLLIASWFLTAIIWFTATEIKENKRRKKKDDTSIRKNNHEERSHK